MSESDERRRAVEALETVQTHQERTRRAMRPRWWVYAILFVVVAGVGALTDVVSLSGTRILAIVLVVLLIAVLVLRFSGKWTSPLNRLRGVQARREVDARRYGLAILVGFAGFYVIVRYGPELAGWVGGATGLSGYPGTVSGVITGALFAAWTAVVVALGSRAQR